MVFFQLHFVNVKLPQHLAFAQVVIVPQNFLLNDSSMFCFCLRQDTFIQASPELADSLLLSVDCCENGCVP